MILYAITDEKLTPSNTIYTQVENALIGGVSYLQLRDKTLSFEESLERAIRLKELCDRYNAKFIVNDSVKLAKESNAHGVHLGESDGELKKARDILGAGVIIGSSCYGSLELANSAIENGASYIAFGAMFTSSTKPNAKVAPLSVLTEAKKLFNVPICAIGGIKLNNAKSLTNAGADMLAVISSLWQCNDVALRAKEFFEFE
jgi:thiamine-phosphate pyrophosphorylase